MVAHSSPTNPSNPTGPSSSPSGPTRRIEWRGRARRWLWLGLAAGIWGVGMVATYYGLAQSAASSLETARIEVQAAVAQLPTPDELASSARAGPATAEAISAMSWISRVNGVFADSLGQQTLPPRLPGGVARVLSVPVEVFASLPHYGISSGRSNWPHKAAPECALIDPEILADELRLANWRAELEDQPRQLLENRSCYALVVEWRESVGALPSVAFDVAGVTPPPPAHWFEPLERDELPASGPELAGAVWAARRLADSAVVHAAGGDAGHAREHLTLALAACDALSGIGWVTGNAAWTEAEIQVLERVALCLVLLDPAEMPAELDAHLVELRPRERYLAALPGELRLIERDFARARQGLPTRARNLGGDDFGRGPIATLQLDQELADNFRAWLAHAKWAEGAPYSAGGPPLHVQNVLSSNAFEFQLMPPSVGSRHPWGELAALGELLQLARIATRDGAAAAQAAAAARIDPFSGGAFITRLDLDGTLVLWSVGEDRKNDDAQPRLACEPALDIVVRVLAR